MRLVPYHCLGSLWSQRDKKGREGVCWSVRATIRQFNRLANTVLASCLCPTKLRSQQRVQLLEKWISVAEVSPAKTCSLKSLFDVLEKCCDTRGVNVLCGQLIGIFCFSFFKMH